jgi:methylated-DNA-[protein]-cysteine S-methyltransferase
MPKNFSDRVRRVVAKIPKGETLSYGEVARRAGNPKAARAVGAVMSKNFDPQIPCHRVVSADGAPGGYNRGGPEAKRRLLAREARAC